MTVTPNSPALWPETDSEPCLPRAGMAAARRPAVRFGPATSPPSRFPQVNYCDFATFLAALSATVASALSSAVAAALASTALAAGSSRRSTAGSSRRQTADGRWQQKQSVRQQGQMGSVGHRYLVGLAARTAYHGMRR